MPKKVYRRRRKVGLKSKKLVKTIKGVIKTTINPEVKMATSTVSTTITEAGAVGSIVDIAEGDDYNQRTGRQILMKSLEFRNIIYCNALGVRQSVRFMLIADKGYTGIAPVIADVLESAPYVYSLRASSPQNLNRFTVLFDKLVDVDITADQIQHYRKLKRFNRKMVFDGTLSTSPNSGAIFALYVSDVTANPPTLNSMMRIRFTDS